MIDAGRHNRTYSSNHPQRLPMQMPLQLLWSHYRQAQPCRQYLRSLLPCLPTLLMRELLWTSNVLLLLRFGRPVGAVAQWSNGCNPPGDSTGSTGGHLMIGLVAEVGLAWLSKKLDDSMLDLFGPQNTNLSVSIALAELRPGQLV